MTHQNPSLEEMLDFTIEFEKGNAHDVLRSVQVFYKDNEHIIAMFNTGLRKKREPENRDELFTQLEADWKNLQTVVDSLFTTEPVEGKNYKDGVADVRDALSSINEQIHTMLNNLVPSIRNTLADGTKPGEDLHEVQMMAILAGIEVYGVEMMTVVMPEERSANDNAKMAEAQRRYTASLQESDSQDEDWKDRMAPLNASRMGRIVNQGAVLGAFSFQVDNFITALQEIVSTDALKE